MTRDTIVSSKSIFSCNRHLLCVPKNLTTNEALSDGRHKCSCYRVVSRLSGPAQKCTWNKLIKQFWANRTPNVLLTCTNKPAHKLDRSHVFWLLRMLPFCKKIKTLHTRDKLYLHHDAVRLVGDFNTFITTIGYLYSFLPYIKCL